MEQARNNFEKVFTLFCDSSNLMPQTNIMKAVRTAGYVVDDSFADICAKSHITLEEFAELLAKAHISGLNRDKIEDAFRFYDPESTGYIKAAELKKILAGGEDGLSETDINVFFEAFPPNDRGMVCYTLPIKHVFDSER